VTVIVPAFTCEHIVPLHVIPDNDNVGPLAEIVVSPAAALADPVIVDPVILIVPRSCTVHDDPPSHPYISRVDPLPTMPEIMSAATEPDTVAFCMVMEPIFADEHVLALHVHPAITNDAPWASALMPVIPILF
jgi:hypothetical protein